MSIKPDKSLSIAFVFPPGGESSFFQHHLGVGYIQAYLALKGIKTKQIIPPSTYTLPECAEFLLEHNAPVYGFTCFDQNYYLVNTLASEIKRKQPDAVVIIGGPSATFSDKEILNHSSAIDICVRFEGEQTSLELIQTLLGGRGIDHLHDVQGISFRNKKSVIRTPDRPLLYWGSKHREHLDQLPSPFLSGFLDGSEGTGILTARGCTHECTYCNFAAMSRHKVRYHSVDRVVSELKFIQDSLSDSSRFTSADRIITIYDDAFSLNPQRAKTICRRIIKERINLYLNCCCRADNLDEELAELMKQAGFTQISFGVESGRPWILRNIKKVCSTPPKGKNEEYLPEKRFLSQVEAGVELAKRKNLSSAVSIILGLPGETFEDGKYTVDYVQKMNVDTYAHNYLSVCPGTEIFKTAKEFGIEYFHSEFLLPYITKHTYPITHVPFGRNSSRQRRSNVSAMTILRSFTDGRVKGSVNGDGIGFASIEIKDISIIKGPFSWLAKNLMIAGKIILICDSEIQLRDLSAIRQALCDTRLRASEFYCLNSHQIDKHVTVLKSFLEYDVPWPYQFPIIPLSKCFQEKVNHEFNGVNNRRIYSINNELDLYTLSALSLEIIKNKRNAPKAPFPETPTGLLHESVKMGSTGSTSVEKKEDNHTDPGLFWLDGVVQDGCRWQNDLCPAIKLQRINLMSNGEIYPCCTGKAIGTLNEDIETLRARLAAKYDHIREERNCDVCPAESRCSKCIYPHPVDQKLFCEYQREFSGISEIVARAKIANTFDPFFMKDI